MRLLITGGAGFIGSNLVRYLLSKESSPSIINLDLLTYAGSLENLEGLLSNPKHTFIQGDIACQEVLNSLFGRLKPELVINLAAETHVDRSIEDPAPMVRSNIRGTQLLLEMSKKYRIQKFLQVSTDEVYGSLKPEEEPWDEESPLKPRNPYSASKAAADLMVMAYHQTYRLPVLISRCGNNYGPRQHPEKLVPKMITCALSGKGLPLYGDGQNIREWIHVRDHCRALELILKEGKPGRVYNIGSGEEKTNLEIVQGILSRLSLDKDLIEYIEDRPGHDRRYALDTHRINRLGWQPQLPFNQGLDETVDWYKSKHQKEG